MTTVEETVATETPTALPPNVESEEKDNDSGRSFVFWIMASVAGTIGLCLLLFIVAVGAGTISGRWENVASMVSIIRDLLLIFLILEAIVIGIAIVVMVVQLSALMNLLQNEITPIVENTQQATQTVKGTAEFMSKRLVKPVISTTAALAGVSIFAREIGGIRKALRPPKSSTTALAVIPEESANDE